MKVLIIVGGAESEREVSNLSAQNILDALRANRYEIISHDFDGNFEPLRELIERCDVVYPAFAGEASEGGSLHKFLSSFNKPIVGTRNYEGLEKAWHKISLKQYCDSAGVATPAWKVVKSKEDILSFGFPCVVKSSSGGSSLEVFILKTESDLAEDEEKIFKYHDLFAEKYMSGTEITVGILNGKSLPIIEIIPPKGEFFSYENKYNPGTQEIPFAPSIPDKVQKEAEKLSLGIHNHFNLGTYSRIDFIVNKGKPYVLEVNTIPGMTKGSLFPKQALAAGLDFNKLVNILINSAN